ncbi:MAG: molybdenum ABC transporter ATP-binding protein [Xanthomonadales bacterium]|nr:molybdenum ABC transporter ATP-binding protein [Xanthomonadales bacterium]
MSIRARFNIQQEDFRLDVDLDLPGSGVTSLFGPSGCGKTSLLRAMAGLDHHHGGFLQVEEQTWQDAETFLPPHRRPLAYVFQEPSLFEHLDVRRNIAYGTKRIPAAEQKVSMQQAIELLDVGRLLDRKPASLSGGERQRVAIARALAVSPRLLLMDEPLAAVDVSRKQEILPYIESLHRELEIPVIHVSHLPEEVAQFADFVVLIGDGGVLASGDVNEVFTRLDLPPAHDSDASSLVEARVCGHDMDYHLTQLAFPGGELLVALKSLPEGRKVRLRVAARDVSLTLQRQSGTSILNILETTVDEIRAENHAKVLVRLMAGPTPLLASITRKSAHELQLEPGKTVFAQVKSVALLS